MTREERLAGKKALVTGAGTGIGREIALEFARQGADVALHYAHSDKGAKSAVEEIQAMGRKAAVFKADFGGVEEVAEMGSQAIRFLGGVNCLVNNAGITFNKPFLKVTPEQFDMMYRVNVRAQFFLTQRIVQHMLAHGGGAICNISSIHGLQGVPEHSVYAGTKGAIISYTRALAIELAHKGIRLNVIAPGAVMVEGFHKAIPGYTEEKARQAAKDAVPVGHSGKPLDIARLAVFLCSDEAQYIVGQTIVADGGTTAMMSLVRDFRSEMNTRFGAGYLPGV
jgi:NAD(P)-dependent dehydrogenase (short-subunit alcohol dehydrogenase family)